jgi:hypothetical protein
MGKRRYTSFKVSKKVLPDADIQGDGWRARIKRFARAAPDRLLLVVVVGMVVCLPLLLFGAMALSLFQSERMVTHECRIVSVEQREPRFRSRSRRVPDFILRTDDGREFKLRRDRMPQTLSMDELEARLNAAPKLTIVTFEGETDILGLNGPNLDIPWMDGYRAFRDTRRWTFIVLTCIVAGVGYGGYRLFRALGGN